MTYACCEQGADQIPCKAPKTVDISHEAQPHSGNSQPCSPTDGFRTEGEHVGITRRVRPEGYRYASMIDHAATTESSPVSRHGNPVMLVHAYANHANEMVVIGGGICQGTDSSATTEVLGEFTVRQT